MRYFLALLAWTPFLLSCSNILKSVTHRISSSNQLSSGTFRVSAHSFYDSELESTSGLVLDIQKTVSAKIKNERLATALSLTLLENGQPTAIKKLVELTVKLEEGAGENDRLVAKFADGKGIGDGLYQTSLLLYNPNNKLEKLSSDNVGVLIVKGFGKYVSFIPYEFKNAAYPPEISAFTEEEKQSQRTKGMEIQKQIYAAINRGVNEFKIPTGHYRFIQEGPTNGRPWYLNIHLARNFTLDGQGSTIWFESEKPFGFLVVESNNVTIKNLTVDYDPLPYFQGTIVGIVPIADHFVKLRFLIDPGFEGGLKPYLNPDTAMNTLINICAFSTDVNKGLLIKPDWIYGRLNYQPIVPEGNGIYSTEAYISEKTAKETGLEVGDGMAFTPRDGGIVFPIWTSRNVRIENVRIYASANIGINGFGSSTNNVYDHIKIMRRPNTRRYISTDIDALNYKEYTHGPIITNSIIEAPMDDAIAMNNNNMAVVKKISPNSYVVAHRGVGLPLMITRGSNLSFHGSPTNAFHGEATITDMKPYSSALMDMGVARNIGVTSKFVAWDPSEFYVLTLDRDSPQIELGDAVIQRGAENGFQIKNNFIYGNNVRAILVTGENGVVSDNVIESAGKIHLGRDPYWLEGTFPINVLVENNTFIKTRIDFIPITVESFVGQNSRITIRNNKIVESRYAGIIVNDTEGISITGNVLEKTNQVAAQSSALPFYFLRDGDLNYGIILNKAKDWVLKDNLVIHSGQGLIRAERVE